MQIFDHTKSKHFCLNYMGLLDDTTRWLEKQHMLNEDMWRLFVNQYRLRPDGETNAWRGEYWGKMMRGAVALYIYTRNDELYRVITDTVEDMLSTQDSLGRFSTYEIAKEFGNWDLWCRKYVMLGFQYYLEICKDEELKKRIVKAVSAHADYIIEKIGPSQEGKREINDSGFEFLKGLNASTILEPIMDSAVMYADDGYVSLKRGPIVLAGDEMFGNNLDDAVSLNENLDRTVDVTVVENSYFDSSLCVTVPMTNKTKILMCDYASAGKQWNNKKRIAAWLPSI